MPVFIQTPIRLEGHMHQRPYESWLYSRQRIFQWPDFLLRQHLSYVDAL